MIVDNAPGLGFRIERIWAFVSVADDNDEGVAAFNATPVWTLPMVAADEERVASLRPIARQLAKLSGKPIKLVRFETRVEEEVFEP